MLVMNGLSMTTEAAVVRPSMTNAAMVLPNIVMSLELLQLDVVLIIVVVLLILHLFVLLMVRMMVSVRFGLMLVTRIRMMLIAGGRCS